MPLSDYDYTFKVLLIGNSGVGKSSLLGRYTEGDFSKNLAKTIGVDFKTKTIKIDRTRVKLQIWDTAGQERFRTITSTFYRGAVGVIIAYDITDAESFADLMTWVENLREEFLDAEVPVVYIGGNKCDLEAERQVQYRDARKLFARLSASILMDKKILSGELLSETVKLSSHSFDTHSSYYGNNQRSCCLTT